MRSLTLAAIGAVTLTLGACSSNVTVQVPNISPTEFASESKVPGNYAVWVQTGGWQEKVEAKAHQCGAWSFPTDFDTAYKASAQTVFSENFQNIKFVDRTLTPDEITADHLDAEIIVYQGSLHSSFSADPHFWWGATMSADANINGIVAVVGPDGLKHQGNVNGTGTGTMESGGSCEAAGGAIAQAGGNAVKNFLLSAVNSSKLNIMEIKLNDAQKKSATLTN